MIELPDGPENGRFRNGEEGGPKKIETEIKVDPVVSTSKGKLNTQLWKSVFYDIYACKPFT